MKEHSHDTDNLDQMRRRLYARPEAKDMVERHKLTDVSVDVNRNWKDVTPAVSQGQVASDTEPTANPATKPQPQRRRYRLYILLVSLFIFVFGAGLSSLYLYLGGNEISSDNIVLNVTGPFTIGGGETLNFDVAIENQNTVAMESATLIVKYPQGTRSVGDSSRNIFEERIPIEALLPGESVDVPLQIIAFGEEQAQQRITATIEYRITGSNSVFYKDAEPYDFSISSSPVVLRVQHPNIVSSGQAVDIEMTVVSNASSVQRDVLISASYPSGFRFESANPAAVFGNTVWKIDELEPQQSVTITLSGVVTGFSDESLRINFDLGPAQSDDPFIVASLLAEASADFTIENPFIAIKTEVNGEETSEVVLEENEKSRVNLEVTNTLDSAIYDLMVEVIPGGNVLNERSIQGANGFFDSNSGAIRWEASNNSTFRTVGPGESRRLNFSIDPASTQATASYNVVVNVYAKRVAEPNAQAQLVGTTLIEAKYDSSVLVGSQAGRGGIFPAIGVIPPQVGETTSYTVLLVAEAGVNDLTDVVVTSALPIYVTWLDQSVGGGDLIYNSVSKQLEWQAGPIEAGTRKEISFQVSVTPSSSQVGSSLMLMQSQTMRATDRFTGSRLQAQAEPVYTELSTEAGFEENNGTVIR